MRTARATSTTSNSGESRTIFGTDEEKQQPFRVYKRRRGLNGPLFIYRCNTYVIVCAYLFLFRTSRVQKSVGLYP